MNRSVMINGAVLGASLLAAYLVWTREPSSDKQDETKILSFHTLDRVAFAGPSQKVSIERKKDKTGAYHWVRIETEEKKPPRARPTSAFKRALTPPTAAKAVPPKAAAKAAPPRAAAKPPRRVRSKVIKPPPKAPTKAEPKAPPKAPTPSTAGPASLAQDPKADPAAKAPAPAPATPTPTPQPKTPPATSGALPAPPAAAPKKAAAPKPEMETKVKVFVANQMAKELFETLANLPAARALGTLSSEKLEEFGLANSETTLTIVSGSTTRTFRVGERTYGNLDYYLRDDADKRVYVVRQDLIEQVKNARSRLFTANLHDFTLADIERIAIESDGKSKTLWQHGRERPGAAYWTEDEDAKAQAGEDAYRNWVGKLDALRVKEYTAPNDKPTGLQPIGKVTYYKGDEQLGFVTLYEQTSPSLSAKPTAGKKYYAQTEHTRVSVLLYGARVQELLKGLADLLKE